jgi:hypothetical protein
LFYPFCTVIDNCFASNGGIATLGYLFGGVKNEKIAKTGALLFSRSGCLWFGCNQFLCAVLIRQLIGVLLG